MEGGNISALGVIPLMITQDHQDIGRIVIIRGERDLIEKNSPIKRKTGTNQETTTMRRKNITKRRR